jgi:IS30 family transposase
MGQEQDIRKSGGWKQLTEKDRYQIEALVQAKAGTGAIARQLNKDRRTIQREIKRGKVIQNISWELKEVYRADYAQMVREKRAANKGRGLKIGRCHELAKYLEQKIVHEGYSPDAAIKGGEAQGQTFAVSICTKTVYNYIDAELFTGISNEDLPVKKVGKKRSYNYRQVALRNTKGRSIEERPEIVNARQELGHWEMDSVESGQGDKSCLLVMTERASRRERIFKMDGKKQEHVKAVLDQLEKKHGEQFSSVFKTITVDNGSEFLSAESLETSDLKSAERRTTIYYAHPYSAYERGSNENANKLIRRFIPKGAKISLYSHSDIQRIERWMNHYPRRILGYETPIQVYAALSSCGSVGCGN